MECTVKEYIQSKPSILDKIKAIETLIDNMVVNSLEAVEVGGTASYSMDDGQMKVTTEYRSMSDISKGIKGLEQILQIYVSRYNGRVTYMRGNLRC